MGLWEDRNFTISSNRPPAYGLGSPLGSPCLGCSCNGKCNKLGELNQQDKADIVAAVKAADFSGVSALFAFLGVAASVLYIYTFTVNEKAKAKRRRCK